MSHQAGPAVKGAGVSWDVIFQRLDDEHVAAALQLAWGTIDGRVQERHVEAFRAADLAMREHMARSR